jgi:hypothetical protein
MAIIENNGKLEVDFNKKASVIDLKKIEDALRQLVWMVANLDERLRRLEKR